MVLKCLVACEGIDGPQLVPVRVECNNAQYENGMHYVSAANWASEEDFDGPMVVMDERDPVNKAVFDAFDWESADIISSP